MELSICSYSFHRALEAGKQDMFKYITDCRDLGATRLDPWMAHLAVIHAGDAAVRNAASEPHFSAEEMAYLQQVKSAAELAGLPFGCLAVDGAHIYDESPEVRRGNRAVAYRWLEAAAILGVPQVRIDAGGPAEMTDEIFAIIVEGYRDLVARGRQKGIEILIENHWGPSPFPEFLVRLFTAVPALGLLLDTNNWAPGWQQKGWQMCARYARATHIKTFEFDEQGNERSADLIAAIKLLQVHGYDGCWGVESCPRDGDEYEGVRKTFALIRRAMQ